MATARGLLYRGKAGVRTLSSRAAQYVGRPSPARWSNRTAAMGESKKGVRRLIRRDPARGRTMPVADAITETKMESNAGRVSSPGVVSRDKSAPPGANKTQVSNRGVNRSVKKR